MTAMGGGAGVWSANVVIKRPKNGTLITTFASEPGARKTH